MMNGFGEKLRLFMQYAKIKNVTLARAVNVDPALVSYWLSGKRQVRRDSELLPAIADFMIRQCNSEVGMRWLSSVIGIDYDNARLEYNMIKRNIVDWLCLEEDLPAAPVAPSADMAQSIDRLLQDDPPPPRAGVRGAIEIPGDRRAYALVGMAGMREAVELLSERFLTADAAQGIRVYASSEYCSALLDPAMSEIWDYLYTLGGERPVCLTVAQWHDSGRISRLIGALLPQLLNGVVQLFYIQSTEQFFCYNLTIFVPQSCAVALLEPAAPGEQSPHTGVSFFIDAPGFIRSMGQVYDKLQPRCKSMIEILSPERGALAAAVGALYENGSSLDSVSDGFDPLFLPPMAFRLFLEQSGLGSEGVKYRLKQFTQQKEAFELAMLTGSRREILSMPSLDRLVRLEPVALTGLEYLKKPLHRLSPEVAGALLEGIAGALRMYDGFALRLVRGDTLQNQSRHIREDAYLLAQHWHGKKLRCVQSCNWLVVRELRKRFDEVWDGDDMAVRGRENVLEALGYRLDKLRLKTGALTDQGTGPQRESMV